ncbi:MAG: hypothetical protein LBL46_00210, partial [Rickettsiales bacterium]|nr:hypothetical protein [Rickettsiales bacterium]
MADKILSRGDRRKIMIDHIDAKKRDIDLRFGDKIDAAAATDEQKKQIRLDILRARNTADLYISGIEQKILHPMYYQAQDRAELRDELTHSLGGREFLDNLGVKIRDYEDKNQTAQIDAYFENIVAAILAAENPAERMSEWAKTTYKNATLHHDFLREMIRDGLMMREKSRSVFPGRLAEETTIWVELENPILPEQAKSYNLFREITDAADIKITQRQNEKGIFYIDYEIGTLKKTEKLKTIVDAAGWLAKNTDDDRGEENGVDY